MRRAAHARFATLVLLVLVSGPVSATVCLALCSQGAAQSAGGHASHGPHGHAVDTATPAPGPIAEAAAAGVGHCFGFRAMLRDRASARVAARLDAGAAAFDGLAVMPQAARVRYRTAPADTPLRPPGAAFAAARPLIALRI